MSSVVQSSWDLGEEGLLQSCSQCRWMSFNGWGSNKDRHGRRELECWKFHRRGHKERDCPEQEKRTVNSVTLYFSFQPRTLPGKVGRHECKLTLDSGTQLCLVRLNWSQNRNTRERPFGSGHTTVESGKSNSPVCRSM